MKKNSKQKKKAESNRSTKKSRKRLQEKQRRILTRVKPIEYLRDFSLDDFVKKTLSVKGFYSFDDAKAIEAVLINEQASY